MQKPVGGSTPVRPGLDGELLSVGPSIAIFYAAVLLDPTKISGCQAIVFHRVLTCSLQAMLHDGCTNLVALTCVWTALRLTLCRQHRVHGCSVKYKRNSSSHPMLTNLHYASGSPTELKEMQMQRMFVIAAT